MQNQTTSSTKEEKILIKISQLTKKFGNLLAVDRLSLDIFRGEIFGFLGPNGAGKTTTMNMICGLIPPTTGEIKIAGDTTGNNIKNLIGICPQENIFWPKLTCLEQLLFMGDMHDIPRKKTKAKATELLNLMGLEEKTRVLANKLSGGMKRRLNICLALIHDPEIIILDEPEAGLDPQSRVLVRNFIKTLSQTKTILLTTHNMDEADRLAHRVAIIDLGKLLLVDTPENLKKSIGEGDILEIIVENEDSKKMNQIDTQLSSFCAQVSVNGNVLILKGKNLIASIADITDHVKNLGISIKEMTMRENTLEDVFIHLTGRKLRE